MSSLQPSRRRYTNTARNVYLVVDTGEIAARGKSGGLAIGFLIAVPSGVGAALGVTGDSINALKSWAVRWRDAYDEEDEREQAWSTSRPQLRTVQPDTATTAPRSVPHSASSCSTSRARRASATASARWTT